MSNSTTNKAKAIICSGAVKRRRQTSKSRQDRMNISKRERSDIMQNNRFAPLMEINNEVDMKPTETIPTVAVEPSSKPQRKRKLPPLVIHQKVANHRLFTNGLKDLCKKGFHIKYVENETKIFIDDASEWQAVKESFSAKGLEFHTYTLEEDKPMEVVLRGLPEGYQEDILAYLQEEKLDIKQVLEMKGPHISHPAYKCNFSKATSFRDISKINYVLSCRVYWSKYKNRNKVTQCFRCQWMGHASKNCHSKPKCVKCGDNHLTSACVKDKTTVAKCANCEGEHPANYSKCITRQNYKTTIEKRKAYRRPRYTAAPIPEENPWKNNNSAVTEAAPPRNLQHFPNLIGKPAGRTIPTMGKTCDTSKIETLFDEINQLYNICDIDRLITVVRAMKEKLKYCKDDLSRIQVIRDISLQYP